MKIAFIIGTRPEIIKMSPLIALVERMGIEYLLIHTGQHYDREMSEQFFLDLELRQPDFNIGVGSGSHGKQTAMMMEGIEEVLVREKPDIVLVEGDTNAVLAGALTSAKLHIPVGHVEAGLRSHDKTMPEEINRLVADVCTQIFYVPTEKAALNLLFEGVDPHNIFITGNTIVDACLRNIKIARKNSEIMSQLAVKENILTVTLHRAENVDEPGRLINIIEALLDLEEFNIIFPVHPRTVKNLEKFELYSRMDEAPHIQMIKPIGYLDFLVLLSHSKITMTDSGGIQEEAITLKVPCLTMRYNTERPETVKAGGNLLVGADKEKIVQNARNLLENVNLYQRMSEAPNPYGDGKASEKILEAIITAQENGELDIKPPGEIMGEPVKKLIEVEDNVTVAEFEAKYQNSRVNLVFEDDKARFPDQGLELEGKTIIVSIDHPG